MVGYEKAVSEKQYEKLFLTNKWKSYFWLTNEKTIFYEKMITLIRFKVSLDKGYIFEKVYLNISYTRIP